MNRQPEMPLSEPPDAPRIFGSLANPAQAIWACPWGPVLRG
jgi:hypothetical protein